MTTPHPKPLAADPLLDSLAFLARFFGRAVEADQIVGGMPRHQGRIDLTHLDEAARNAGLGLTRHAEAPATVKPTALPALVVDASGDAIVVLHRKADQVEVHQPGIEGTRWMPLADLVESHPGQWIFVRPHLRFDQRSLIYHLDKPQRWFWDVFRRNRKIYGWALLATVVINLLGAVVPFYTMAIYDRVVPNNATDSLWVLTTAVVVITVFDMVMKLLRGYLVESAARRADVQLSSNIFSQAVRLRAASRPASGGVLANLVRDFEAVREFAASSTITLLGDLPFMLFFLVVIALIGGWLALVPLTLIPITLGVSWWLRKPIGKALNANMEESSQRTAHLFEVMNGLDSVKCLNAEAWARRRWESLTVRISESTMRMREWATGGNHFATSMTGLSTIMIVMFGALLIAEGELTLGQLIATSMLAGRAMAPANQIAGLILRFESVKTALGALEQIMTSPTDDREDSLYLPNLKGDIRFSDVHFGYPDAPPLLAGLNLRIAPGERVGFIGRIGSGKTTLLKMLLNLYGADQGAVTIDGISVSEMDPHALRRQIGYVPQDVVLFHGSVKENILLGSTDVSDEALIAAVRTACLEDTLARMPQGLGTQVGERGERLSGGQRQAVAIARALAHEPTMLLLDEPSSMMDPGTEAQLINNLRERPDMTLLLVTHRTAMLPLVDRLVVMDNGKVIADGPRDEILRRLAGNRPTPSAATAAAA